MTVPVRLIIFDFDQTLSVIHVFKTLAGWNADKRGGQLHVPEPFAASELGQITRIIELDCLEEFRSHGGFAKMAFGGDQRVQAVRKLLAQLKERGVAVIICTKGLIGTVRKILSDLSMLDYFDDVFGLIDKYEKTDYDQSVGEAYASGKYSKREEPSKYFGSPDNAEWRSKGSLILRLTAERNLKPSEVLFVDDDPHEIKGAEKVCRVLWVQEASGLNDEHFANLRQMTGCEPVPKTAGTLVRADYCNCKLL